ncbi:methyltransferase domain-containing protein [Paenibacillus sp. PR3]|uniref:Methyltransferase domain-containing protein n=1 Tax=Paenibacillus terricola TaxID=2763503 RepID=A0ABR8N1X5_9BACL|nr:class I SAM-dependent methyltransferase [Paenibacillus terricola]MBD3922179.1 methyltransferase domain-containing protein [Paenibacillus terricola]
MNRIELIRQEEKRYHDDCYERYSLFEPGSWLHKPVKTVLEQLEHFTDYAYLNVLDLGSGIGRNSIPLAQSLRGRSGRVVCVDLLQSAIDKLQEYSRQYEVQSLIDSRLSDIEHFVIKPDMYDFIVAVSTLEHLRSEQVLGSKIQEMVTGTKSSGVNCIIIGSNIREVTVETNVELDPMFEINLPTDRMLQLLDTQYAGWDIQKRLVNPLTYEINRDGADVRLTTECITYVAKKPAN